MTGKKAARPLIQEIMPSAEEVQKELAIAKSMDDFFGKEGIFARLFAKTLEQMLEAELSERYSNAGVIIKEARISHLAYSAEIAGAMLQRQQATAIVAARTKIVEGAVSMVEMALAMLSEKDIVTLDDDKKAAMVSNLMVVLCGDKAASPVLNTGTLY